MGVFEINSSSTHSYTICIGEYFDDCEGFVEEYTTPRGEKIIVFGKFRYGGVQGGFNRGIY